MKFKLLSCLKNAMAVALIASSVLVPSIGSAGGTFEKFVCTCQALGPGIELNPNSDAKFCSYDCDCIGLNPGAAAVMHIPVSLRQLETSARSKESWDYSSKVCHGQYAYRPTLDAPNWKIKVRFAPFILTSEGVLQFPERIEIAQGVNEEGKKFFPTATEVVQALKAAISPL